MKKFLFFALLLASAVSFSQAPQFLNYQAIARNAGGTIVTTPIGIKFEILQGSASGTLVYEETHNITPSSAGVFTAAIGNGSIVMGNFPTINWANSPYFIRVSIDPTGGTSYSTVGTSQLLSVPYALYAESTKPSTLSITGNSLSINNGNSVTLPAGTSYTAGNGISITGNTITNTAPTPTLIAAGISSITGSNPTFTIDVPPPALNYNTGTQELTLTQGTVITTATITTSSASVSISGPGVTGAYPNYTLTPPPATSITSAGSSILVNGTNPNFTIVPQPSLTVLGNQLSIVDGNTVTLPTGTTYTNGTDIALISGTIITNTAPDKTVTIGSGTNVNVTGTYPSFVVNATPSLSIGSGSISITGGNSVALPNSPATTVTAGTNMIVNGTAPSYTVATPTYSLNFSNSSTGVLTNGINNSAVSLPQPTITLTGANNNVLSVGSNSVTIATYSAGSGLLLGGTFPNFSLSTTSTGTASSWNTLGNTGTNPSLNFLGTTDAQDLVFRTSNSQRMRIFNANGAVGIGNISTASELLQVETGSNTAMSILSGTNSTLYFGNAGNHFSGAIRYDNINNTMSFWNNSTPDRIFIDIFGRVAIGSNFTVSELDVNGSLRLAGSRLFLGAVGGVNSGYTGIYETGSDLRFAVGQAGAPANPPFAAGGNSFDAMTIDSPSGNVGIGITSPAQKLHLFVNANNIGMAIEAGAAGRARLGILPGGVDNAEFGYRNHLTFGTVANSGLVMTNEWMRLTSSGNLGLGTTNPLAKLDISGGLTYFRPNSADVNKILVQDYIGTAMRLYTDASIGTPYDLILGTYPNGHTNQLFLKQSNGYVGIGTISPASRLHVADVNAKITVDATGAGASTSSLDLKTATAGTATFLKFNSSGRLTIQSGGAYNTQFLNSIGGSFQFDEGVNTRLFIAAGGNVGIGTTTPANMLHVNGGVTITDGTQGNNKVLTSNATGAGKWEYPLTPAKIGSGGGITVANSGQYSYDSGTMLVITPAVSGLVILHFNCRYNFNLSIQSQINVGLHINTTGTAPGTASALTVASNVGWATPPSGGGTGDLPVTFFHTMPVTGGTTYYIWYGALDLNYAQTATLTGAKIVATLHGTSGL